MRKKNFCLAVLSASAVLALGASFSSFAAWKSVNSEWVYTDNNGNNVTSAWRSDNGESYYLGSDGYMVRNTLLEDNGNYYYLRNGGQMLKNGWRFLENPSWQGDDKVGDASWYYFDNNGRALRTTGDTVKIADIGGKKFAFDMYGRMLTGWITAAGENISDDSDWQQLHTTVTRKATEVSLQTPGYTSALRTMTTRTITSRLTTSTSLPTVRRPSAQRRPSAM